MCEMSNKMYKWCKGLQEHKDVNLKSFREGCTSVLVATESFELGVNNPNITEVIQIGLPGV